jgi:hypothetical protein
MVDAERVSGRMVEKTSPSPPVLALPPHRRGAESILPPSRTSLMRPEMHLCRLPTSGL